MTGLKPLILPPPAPRVTPSIPSIPSIPKKLAESKACSTPKSRNGAFILENYGKGRRRASSFQHTADDELVKALSAANGMRAPRYRRIRL